MARYEGKDPGGLQLGERKLNRIKLGCGIIGNSQCSVKTGKFCIIAGGPVNK
jgi:hypothetical protein